jgi:hypothetical protein
MTVAGVCARRSVAELDCRPVEVGKSMSLTPTSLPPLGSGLQDTSPAVVHVRHPTAVASDAIQIDGMRGVTADDLDLPPVVLRLPNLASLTKRLPHSTLRSIGSIAHWTFLVLGGVLALWLIFGNRAKPLPAPDDTPVFTQPARAEASKPAWNPPPLESAGDSIAPAWSPPAAAPVESAPAFEVQTPAPAAPEAPVTEQPGSQTPATEPSRSDAYSGGASSVARTGPVYEAWPATEQPPAHSTPQMPTADGPSAAAGPGPDLRTARREPAPAATVPAPRASNETVPPDDVVPLGITVPVPQ